MDFEINFNDDGGDIPFRKEVISPFRKGVITCQICGDKSRYHCGETDDGKLAICRNVSNDRPTKDGKAYIHDLPLGSSKQPVKTGETPVKRVVTVIKADANRLDEVYRAYLNELTLSESHNDNLLLKRGLSELAIIENLYSSVPDYHSQRFEIAQKLAESFDLEGVPGFYREKGQWAMNVLYDGIYVPFKNEKSQIVGLQIRKDKFDPVKKDKYLWVSSSSRDKGSSSGSPLHFVNSESVRVNKTVFITEGALKADIIGHLYDVGVVAMGGVNVLNPEALTNKLSEIFPDTEKILLAFDMDWDTNKDVRRALLELVKILNETSFNVEAIIWNKQHGKGLDDVLWNASRIDEDPNNLLKYISSEEYQQMLITCEEEYLAAKAIAEDKSEDKNIDVIENTNEEINTFGMTCRDFLAMDLPDSERVIHGLGRGTLGLMVASTNIGKTTLALNLALSAGMNNKFLPLFDENHEARRVMYIDGEASKVELQSDILTMLESCSEPEKELIKDNLCFICDEELGDEPLDLVNPDHLKIVREKALEFKPDLIIVDTLSALTIMEDENDNAKVKKEVIQPLKTLGKKSNAGVLLLHHTGKFAEGSFQAEDAFKGRGASALGALARVVFNLKKGNKNSGTTFLSCSKVKGEKFDAVELKLNENTRWFEVIGKASASNESKNDANYTKVVSFVRDYVIAKGTPVKRGAIVSHFDGQISRGDVDRKLKAALVKDDLTQPKSGYYSVLLAPEGEVALAE